MKKLFAFFGIASRNSMILSLLFMLLLFMGIFNVGLSQTNPTAQSIPYSQDFSSLAYTSTTYPAGLQGWTIATAPGSTFNTSGPTADRTLTASSNASTNSGNVHNYNGKIGYLNSSSLDLTLVLAINSSGYSSIQVSYDVMTIRNPYDGSSNTRINEVTLQYRVGTSGSWTNLTGVEYQNNTTLQTGAVTTPQNSQSKTITLPSGCNDKSVIQLRWASRQVSGGGSRPSFAFDNISVTGTAISSPSLTVLPTSLTGFNYVQDNGPSSSQNYTLSGNNLTGFPGNITVTGSTNYEVSSDDISFGNTASIPYSSGTLSGTPVYVRLKAGLSAGNYNSETISNTGGGASQQNVTASGFVLKSEPSAHVTNFNVGEITSNSINLTWTDAEGKTLPDAYLIKGSSVDFASITDPANGTPEADGLLVKNVTQGNQTYTFTGLNSSTSYYFKIYPYTNSGSYITYKTNETVPTASATTSAGTLTTDYFRSKNSGSWSNLATWESSTNNSDWINATIVPDYNANVILIQNSHTVTISSTVTVDQIEIQNGGILSFTSSTLNVNDGVGDDITIDNGGIFNLAVGSTPPSFSTNSTCRIKTGGILRVSASGITGNGAGINLSNFVYENASVLDYTLTSSFSSSGVTFFPNADANTIPIFRISGALSGNPGGSSATVFNGIIEVNSSFTWTGSGTKTFRNGITGTANMSQGSSGQFIISGTTAQIGGTGNLTLSTNGMVVNSGVNLSLSSNKTINTGTVTLNGSLDCGNNVITGTGNFILSNGATLITANTDGISTSGATGSVQVSGTKTFNAGANFMYNGSSAQISGDGLPLTVNKFTINNSTGLTLSNSLNVSDTLFMTSGNINTGANTLTLGSSVSSLGTLSRTTGTIIGNFERWFDASTVGNVLFPVGTETSSRLVYISFTGAPTTGGTLKVSHLESDPGNNGHPTIYDGGYFLDVYATTGYWSVITGNGFAGGTYSIDINASGFLAGISPNDYTKLHLMKRVDGSSDWIVEGSHVSSSGNTAIPILHRTGLTSFSQFGIGSNSADNSFTGAMPVELISFNSSVANRNVTLNWTTAKEINNSGFDVMRSLKNENNWINLGFVKGMGTTQTNTSYSFEDKKLNTGKYQYRLKQIDNNGNYKYYNLDNVIEVAIPKTFNLSQNYPNPFNPVTKIDFELPFDSRVRLVIYDVLGREVKSLVSGELKQAGYYTVELNASSLASGMYFYRMLANGQGKDNIFTKKLVVIK